MGEYKEHDAFKEMRTFVEERLQHITIPPEKLNGVTIPELVDKIAETALVQMNGIGGPHRVQKKLESGYIWLFINSALESLQSKDAP